MILKSILVLTVSLLLWGPVAIAQSSITVGCAPMPIAATKEILSKRGAKVVQPWACTVANLSPEPVAVTESAVLGAASTLTPYTHEAASAILTNTSKLSAWAVLGRLIGDGTALAAFFGSSGIIPLTQDLITGLSGFVAYAPYIKSRLAERDVPVMKNFEALAWPGVVSLQPGDRFTGYIFTAPAKAPHYNSFTIDTGGAASMKVLQ